MVCAIVLASSQTSLRTAVQHILLTSLYSLQVLRSCPPQEQAAVGTLFSVGDFVTAPQHKDVLSIVSGRGSNLLYNKRKIQINKNRFLLLLPGSRHYVG